ncbi:hypothetical protein Tco_1302600 [Tanacetum coccineum]
MKGEVLEGDGEEVVNVRNGRDCGGDMFVQLVQTEKGVGSALGLRLTASMGHKGFCFQFEHQNQFEENGEYFKNLICFFKFEINPSKIKVLKVKVSSSGKTVKAMAICYQN